jgi:hypothetical protein
LSRRVIQVVNRNIVFAADDPLPLVNRVQAMLKLRITDELTAAPPESSINLTVLEKGYTPRVADGGLAGLIGIPIQVVPALNSNDYFVNLTISARNYLTCHHNQKIPKDPDFPTLFAAKQVDIELHREPVTIFGRTMARTSGQIQPLGGAQINITGIWRTMPSANLPVAPDPPNIVSLQTPLCLDRNATSQLARPVDLPFAAGPGKFLEYEAEARSSNILVSDRQGLSNNDVLAIDADRPDHVEFVEIEKLPTTGAPDQPALIKLNQNLIRGHRRDSVVKKTIPSPPGLSRPFTVGGSAGDSAIFLDNTAGLSDGHEIQITGTPGKDEYHRISIFSTISDSEGFYRLPPFSRVAQIEIHAEKTIGVQAFEANTIFCPDYRQRENHLDLTLQE